MAGWQFGHHSLTEDLGESEDDWAARISDEGWRSWMGPGVWMSINGQQRRGWVLRRWVERPNAIAVTKAASGTLRLATSTNGVAGRIRSRECTG